MKSLWSLQFNEISFNDRALVGGKAASVGELTAMGMPVPPGFVITVEAYYHFASSCPSISFLNELMLNFDKLNVPLVAVRSSAVAEDSPAASWAGQFESVLNVERADLTDAVTTCWRSVKQAQAYASLQRASKNDMAVGVMVQAMVISEVAGVAFSRNPVTDTAEIVIEAVEGLGEQLVQGHVTPDGYLVDRSDGIKRDGSLLSDVQIHELVELVRKIEHHYKSSQDIEWAYADGQFYILQSRPITTLRT